MNMTPRLSLGIRLASLHATINTVTAVQTPLWPVFLAWRGLSPVEIGLILSAAYVVRIVSNPVVGNISDRLGDRRTPLLVLAVVSLISYLAFALVGGFWGLMILTLVSSGAYTALQPLADNLTLLVIPGQRIHYGHVRVFGSLAFMVVSGLATDLLVGQPPLWIVWAIGACTATIFYASWRLPRVTGERPAGGGRGIRVLMRSPTFLLFLAAAGLNQSSHTALYGFATLHWQASGLSGGEIGFFWAEGVAAEAIFFSLGHRIAARIGPCWMLVLGGAGGVIRWLVTASTVDPVMLASVQWMHCLTFTASHLAAMYFIQRSIPIEFSGRAQSLYAAIALGLNFGLFLPLAGWLYQAIGGGPLFTAMAVMSAAGLGASLLLLRVWKGGPVIAPTMVQAA